MSNINLYNLQPNIDTENATLLPEAAELELKKRFFHYAPHGKQLQYHAASAHARFRLFLAGNRTGKTYGGVIESAMHLTGRYPDWWDDFNQLKTRIAKKDLQYFPPLDTDWGKGRRFNRPIKAWAASVTTALTTDVLEDGYFNVIAEDLIVPIDKQRHCYGVLYATGGVSELTFKSYEQGRKKFQAAKLDLIHLDEEPSKDIYNECLTRLMSTEDDNQGILLLTMTPLLGLTDLILEFQERVVEKTVKDKSGQVNIVKENIKCDECIPFENRYYIQATWDDNPHLREDDKANIRMGLKPHEREAREKGIPSLGSGLVYPFLMDGITVPPFPIPEHWGRVYALDFGWTNPTAALFAAYDRDSDVVYLTAEYYVAERTPQEHAHQLIQMGAANINGVYDPAGEQASQKDGGDLATLYRQSGLRYLSKANNAKEEGVMQVAQRFQNSKLKIFSNLRNIQRELAKYCRDETGKIKKGDDHLMDCMRYLIMSGLSLAANTVDRQRFYQNQSINRSGNYDWMAG